MNLLNLVLREEVWFPMAAVIALIAVAGLVLGYRRRGLSTTTKLACGMNLFYGVLIGVMGLGHLLAVTIKTVLVRSLRLRADGLFSRWVSPWPSRPGG